MVGGNHTIGPSVDTGEVLVCTEAAQKDAILVGGWGIVFAANTIVDVLAKAGSVRKRRIACLQAEDTTTHEARELLVSGMDGEWD